MIDSKIKGLLGLAAKAGKIVAGFDAVGECIVKKKAKLVIVSVEASEKTKSNINYLCERNGTMCIEYGKIDFLSEAIGKKNKAVICVKDVNFATAIKKFFDGGDIIE